MEPLNEVTWLVVDDQFGRPVHIETLPPGTDPRVVMIGQMAKSLRLGWEVEELPGTLPIYFCRKDGLRNCVKIVRKHPLDKGAGAPPMPWKNPVLPG